MPETRTRRPRETPPHPQEGKIRELLTAGHTDAEVRRRTGADLRTIARRRAELGVKATLTRRAPRRHPREAEILAALRRGGTNNRIADELGVDKHAVARVRLDHKLRPSLQQPLSLEQKWASKTRIVEGGHLAWEGGVATNYGTPVVCYKGKTYTAARLAFIWATGRQPVGHTFAECGFDHCVAPAHVDDEPGRQRVREQLRAITGMAERPRFCRPAGHDQMTEGRLGPDGTAYCEACKRDSKRTARTAQTT
ncbi:hypothetical protein B0E38_04747 [Streptomyces sp. 111WW2]|uniref:hypothetical protein n=1 Tax=Streptomyces sp. 111WW2 TaxID=1945515 RepID=UPI000D0C7FAD|nr:hypothetical protein [Streptomyces sp. 111WW2]PSK52421.1 hypothetical protein B0E38_04747 [Streptomyces sp. 111WW2]